MKILAISEVLVAFSKKRSKSAHFIWEICTFWGLSIEIESIIDKIALDFVRFRWIL